MSAVALKVSKPPKSRAKLKPLAERARLSLDEKVRLFEHLSGVKVRVVSYGTHCVRFVAALPSIAGGDQDWVVYDESDRSDAPKHLKYAAAYVRAHMRRLGSLDGIAPEAREHLSRMNSELIELLTGASPVLPSCGLPKSKAKAIGAAIRKLHALHHLMKETIAPHKDLMTIFDKRLSLDEEAPCLELARNHLLSDIMLTSPDAETEDQVKALEASAG